MSKARETVMQPVDNVNQLPPRSGVSYANGRGKNGGAHLYVIQAADGLVKIGRSNRPTVRRRQFETDRAVAMRLVVTFRGQGWREAEVLSALDGERAFGEWFHNTEGFRSLLERALGVPGAELQRAIRRKARVRRSNRRVMEQAVAALAAKIRREGPLARRGRPS